MAMIRWLGEEGFTSHMERMQQEVNRLLSAFSPYYGASRGGPSRAGIYPAVNLYDDGESYIVRAEVPGVDINQLELTVTGDTLNIKGERNLPAVPENASYHRREIGAGTFRRSVTLPGLVDSGKVVASYKNGILEILLPRAEESKQRKISIQAS